MAGFDISIVIPVFNQVRYTRLCLESILPTIDDRMEVVVIDNHSTDGTADYLSTVPGIRVITNPDNLGCAGAWNQGARETAGRWVMFLNNDVLVWPGWLDGLLEAARKDDLDVVSPAIREGEHNYDVASYAREFSLEMENVLRQGAADGICFMVRREVFQKIGMFDENFRIGQFEDTDFFRRARLAGFRLAITGRSFLHHFGSVTQDAIRKKQPERPYAAENRAYYRRKWKLSWWRRFAERRWMKLRGHWWCLTELVRHRHTLKECWIRGRLRHY